MRLKLCSCLSIRSKQDNSETTNRNKAKIEVTYLLSVGVDPDLNDCITLANVGLPCSPGVTAVSDLTPFVDVDSLFFCRDLLMAAIAASLRGLPLGVSKEAEGVVVELDAVVDEDEEVFARLFLREYLENAATVDALSALGCAIVGGLSQL